MKTYTNPPSECDICGTPIVGSFVDGKTTQGPWANMCLICFSYYGVGLGTGAGQQYRHNPTTSQWEKVE